MPGGVWQSHRLLWSLGFPGKLTSYEEAVVQLLMGRGWYIGITYLFIV